MKKWIALFAFVPLFGELPHPYNTLQEVLPFDPSGMYINAVPLEKLMRERGVSVAIELGSWLGKSTRHIASILPEDGIVYAVDHWLGSEEHRHSVELPVLYEQFLSNVIHAHLTEKIVPLRMTTLEAAEEFRKWGTAPDLVYVDAAHDEESVYADLRAYFPLVEGRGILCGDDWGWGAHLGFPVSRAVSRFARENRLRIELHDSWFWTLYESE
jgi:predicted O-methyltransferase YrrM